MRKFILATIAMLVICVSVFANINIEEQHRIQNRSPGYCAWCCIETLGRNQGIKQLEGLTDARSKDSDITEKRLVQIDLDMWEEQEVIAYPKNVGYLPEIRRKLDLLRVKYKITEWDREHLKEAVQKHGCVVYMKTNPVMPGPHAVVLTDYTDKIFRYIDPNGCHCWEGSREWFDYYWDGVAISLEE
jgi:hypothetical protein